MKAVYRVEDGQGKGPYQTGTLIRMSKLAGSDIHMDKNHPTHSVDFPHKQLKETLTNRTSTEYLCACESKKALTKWFYGYNELLRNEGYKFYEIRVKNWLESKSGRQLFIHPKDIYTKKEY